MLCAMFLQGLTRSDGRGPSWLLWTGLSGQEQLLVHATQQPGKLECQGLGYLPTKLRPMLEADFRAFAHVVTHKLVCLLMSLPSLCGRCFRVCL